MTVSIKIICCGLLGSLHVLWSIPLSLFKNLYLSCFYCKQFTSGQICITLKSDCKIKNVCNKTFYNSIILLKSVTHEKQTENRPCSRGDKRVYCSNELWYVKGNRKYAVLWMVHNDTLITRLVSSLEQMHHDYMHRKQNKGHMETVFFTISCIHKIMSKQLKKRLMYKTIISIQKKLLLSDSMLPFHSE